MDGQSNTLLGWELEFPNGSVPQLPSWILNPDSPEAVEDCKREMLTVSLKQVMDKYGITKETVETLIEADRNRLIAEGVMATFPKMGGTADVVERATTSLALDSYSANLHAYDVEGEPENFEMWLHGLLDKYKSKAAVSNINFMIELLDFYKSRGEGEFIRDLFRNRDGFWKFSKGIRPIREAKNALVNGEFEMKQAEQRIDEAVHSANTEFERLELEETKREMLQIHDKNRVYLEDTLRLRLNKAAEVAQDPNIDKDFVTEIVGSVNAEYPQGTTEKPPLMPMHKIITATGAVYIIAVSAKGEFPVEKALSTLCEPVVSNDPLQLLDNLKTYIKGG
jgi:hypothetical protein